MESVTEVNKKGLSGSTLKLIAIVSMVIDHIGAAILGRLLAVRGFADVMVSSDLAVIQSWMTENQVLYQSYMVLRSIGRLAFPIYCFLLIEGFHRTHNVKKYALRLGIFALFSEIPFDLAFKAKFVEFHYQNVFFTLFLGVLAMIALKAVWDRKWLEKPFGNKAVKLLATALVLAVFCVAAELLRTDYGYRGILCIAAMYGASYGLKSTQLTVGSIVFLWEFPASLAFIPIGFYNGERGLKLKYLFYLVYPLHLLLLYFIAMAMGIAGYAPVM